MEQLLTVDEAAKVLSVSPLSLATPRWRRHVGIPTVRVGRRLLFSPTALSEYVRSRADGGVEDSLK